MAFREETTSDHKERLNRVLLYIQENVEAALSLRVLSEVACFSPYHFHRVFTAHVGETLNEYVRRIRLEKAASRLSHSNESITSVALSAGYETLAAFTKAFRSHFGVAPTEFKQIKQNFSVASIGDRQPMEVNPVNAEIRVVPDQKVLFVRKTGRYDKAANEAWSALMGYAYSHRLMNKDTKGIGISLDDPEITPEEKIRYDACITFKGNVKPEGEIGIQTITGGRYAVFLHKGPYEKFIETYRYIFSTWLTESGEKMRDAPCFELYMNRDPRRTKPENLRTEIFVPIE